jgi:hypothetical protein
MSPELIAAVKERLELGHPESEIKEELRGAGYDEQTIAQVYQQAQTESAAPTVTPAIPLAPATTSAADANSVSPQSAVLPGAVDLFQNGWAFALRRFDLVALLAAPFAVLGVLNYLLDSTVYDQQTPVLIGGMALVLAAVFYFVNLATLLFAVSKVDERSVGYSEALTWAKRHGWGLALVYLLSALVLMGGYVLWIIPGVIVSMYIFFAQYVFAEEGITGMAALLRSRDLVRNNWWAIAARLFLLGLLSLLLYFAYVLVAGILIGITGLSGVSVEESEAGIMIGLVFGVAAQIVSAVVTVIGMHAGRDMYRSLAQVQPVAAVPTRKWVYVTLAGIGLVAPAVLIVGMLTLFSLGSESEKVEMAGLTQTLGNARISAEIYYNVNNYSYAGVCDQLKPLVSVGEGVECIDEVEYWALSAETSGGSEGMFERQRYCVDSQSAVAAGELSAIRTKCVFDDDELNITADEFNNYQDFYDEEREPYDYGEQGYDLDQLDYPADSLDAKERAVDLRSRENDF